MILGHSFRKCRDGLDIHDCDGMGDILRPDMALFFDLKCGGFMFWPSYLSRYWDSC